jgi:hypothetical protein
MTIDTLFHLGGEGFRAVTDQRGMFATNSELRTASISVPLFRKIAPAPGVTTPEANDLMRRRGLSDSVRFLREACAWHFRVCSHSSGFAQHSECVRR